MSERITVNDVAKTAACQVANAALHTPQGHVAIVTTAAVAVAAAPILAGVAVGLGAAKAVDTFINWVDSF